MKVRLSSFLVVMAIGGAMLLSLWILRAYDASWHRGLNQLMMQKEVSEPSFNEMAHKNTRLSAHDRVLECDRAIVDFMSGKPFWITLKTGESNIFAEAKSDLDSKSKD